MNCLDISTFNCSGCAMCSNLCPQKAIKMIKNDEGFYVPQIDSKLCVNCGLCKIRCPQLNNVEKNTSTPDCYAVMASDDLRQKSSSGGAFGVISEEILKRNGVVCGAAFDENWVVKHIIVNNKKDLEKLRGSKYVQSFISETLMKEIKTYLDAKKWVCFVGTPCQCAGLKSFLKRDYTTLLLVDLICSKVPSASVFKKFLDDHYKNEKILNIKMRDKSIGWGCHFCFTTTKKEMHKDEDWFRMFLNSLNMNEACVHCKYVGINRVSDITIGDFWGINKIDSSLDDKKGTSCILLNTFKGKLFFNILKWQIKRRMTTQNAIDGNRALLVPFIPHQNRKIFFDRLQNHSFKQVVNECLSTDKNVGILNWWWNSNRGAILTCYALQEAIKDLGYNPAVIKHIPFDYYNTSYQNSLSEKFANKYLNLTDWCHSRIQMRELNLKFDTFVVGSDQIWNHELNWFLQDFYYLNFVELNKNKIAYAASFGKSNFTGNNIISKMVKYYFSRFNSISVRELDAIGLLKEKFDMHNATFVLDPVFLISKDKYEKIIETSKKTEKDFIAIYFIHRSSEKEKLVFDISKKLNIKIKDINSGVPVEDWLYYIKNAKLVISDSFHASCFSIILGVPFLTLFPLNHIDSRMETLANLTNTKNRFFKADAFDINTLKNILLPLNKKEISNLLGKEIIRSKEWLKHALKATKRNYSEIQNYLEAFYASFDDRLNKMEGSIYKLSQKQFYHGRIHIIKNKNKNKIIFKYKIYSILSKLLPIKKYKDKKIKYKTLYKRTKTM